MNKLKKSVIITLRNIGVTEPNKSEEGAVTLRTQEGQYVYKECRNKMGRYLSHPRCKKQGANQLLVSIQAKI